MIGTKFVGRLGNQMFQKAAVLGYSIKHNMPYTFGELGGEVLMYTEPCFEYREIPIVRMTDICLSGYFQSEKYFSHCRQYILDYFNFNSDPIEKVSIHVRRGDYVNIECHPVVTMEYLNKAIEIFKKMGYREEDDFLVFTDDKTWCRDNLPYEIADGNELEDMELMSRCEHNIISNSSFSWWSAWLNRNPNKIVVAPKLWFSGSKENIDVSDLYCKGWVII